MDQPSFKCSCCGDTHEGPPLAWHLNAPDAWVGLSPSDQRQRAELGTDQCIIDETHFFIRGLIEIPVVDAEEPFAWGAWVSLSRTSFERTSELWLDPKRVEEPPTFGWLSNSIPGYPETLNLKTSIHSRPVGVRPLIELEPTEHPLALEQKNGITLATVQRIAERMYHHNSSVEKPRKRFGWF